MRLTQIIIFLFFCFNSITTSLIAESNLKIVDEEKLVFQGKNKENDAFTAETTYYVRVKNKKPFYSYKHVDGNSTWEVATDENAIPSRVVFTMKGNKMTLDFNGEGGVTMSGYWNGKKIQKKGSFESNVTLENALVVRTLNLDRKDPYYFDLLQTSEFPELEAYSMYFEVQGEETITVGAGTFACKKILFSVSGWRGLFYKAYYYISNDTHRYLIKIENLPMGGETELARIE